MKTLQNINEIEKIIRTQLILQSEIQPKYVRNSLSVYGEALEKLLDEQIMVSIENNDVVILFELRSRDIESNVSETNENDTISYYKAFSVYVIIYGDNSTNVANNIVARFRTEKVRNNLHSEGIYLESISNPTKLNEYKNEVMRIRNDFQLDISCHLVINQVDDDYIYAILNDIKFKEA